MGDGVGVCNVSSNREDRVCSENLACKVDLTGGKITLALLQP